MKKKRFQWLSNLRKFVMNNVCWKIRKKNQRKQKIEDIESEILPEAPIFSQQITRLYPDTAIQKSDSVDLESRDPLCKHIFSLEDDTSLLILLTEETVRQHPFPMVRQKALPVIPLPWITKITDIREGNRIELQAGLPTATSYEALERSWITRRIFESTWGSYPYLITQMQVVPYIRKRYPFHLHLISGQLFGEHDPLTRPGKLESTNDEPKGDVESKDFGNYLKDAQIGEAITDMHTSRGQLNSGHLMSKLPSTDSLEINWSGIDINIQELHLTSLLAEDGDYKKLYKGYYGDIHFIAADYRRIPKKLEMNILARLRSPDLLELFGILQHNSHRWVLYVEAKYGDLYTLLKEDPQRIVFNEDCTKFVTMRLLSALGYLQTHGVVHGDVRPSKIFVNNRGKPLLGGLETVTWPSNKTFVRRSPKSMKVGFVAPEVLMGFRPQPASDIFSVGCVAYFMIAGRRPFTKRNELLDKMKAPEILNIKLTPAGLDFISACLQKSIRKRLHLDRGLRCVRQRGWFADMDIYEDSPWSPLIKAIEQLSKDDAFGHEEKCPNAMQ